MPVDPSPEARARALKQCREIDQKWDDFLGVAGRQKMAERHKQIEKFRRQDIYMDRTQSSLRKKPKYNT